MTGVTTGAGLALGCGHLLPVPRIREALAVIVRNVRAARAALPVPLALENVAPLLGWPDDELTEGQFVGKWLWGVAHRLPDLVDQLDGRFPHLFRGYAARSPRPPSRPAAQPPGGSLADARAFAAFAARHLGPAGAAVPGRRA